MRARRNVSWFMRLLGAAGSLILLGCSVGSEPCEPRMTYAVTSPPPAPLPETVPLRPAPGMTWYRGDWHWQATHYVWIPGHWDSPPPGQRWYPARVTASGDAYRYEEGSFGCDRTSAR